MACYTQEEIGELVGVPKQTVNDFLRGLSENPQMPESGQTADDSPAFRVSWR
jgi:hypothetical protein